MIFSQVLAWFADPTHWRGPAGVPVRVAEHLYYTAVAVLLASAVAVPVGLLVGHTGRGGVVLVGLANAMRALPTLGLLTFLFLLVRSQAISTLVTLVVLAVPPVLAGSYAGVRSVDAGVVDAARGMGMTSAQRLWQVELPGALALLLGGVRSAVLQVVATTTVAAYVGLGGLGRLLLDGLNSADYPQTAAGALVIAALALMLDLLLAGLARLMVPTGCRLSRQSGGGRLSRQSDKGPLAAAGEAGKSNTTSPDIAANHWVELADPKHMYPAQRIVPLIRAGSLDQAGIDALNRVSAVLTTATLTELNRRITQDRAAPADLAKDFVNGLR